MTCSWAAAGTLADHQSQCGKDDIGQLATKYPSQPDLVATCQALICNNDFLDVYDLHDDHGRDVALGGYRDCPELPRQALIIKAKPRWQLE
jgi:hypothetical protein